MAVEVFGGGVEDDVEAIFQRALNPRAGEGVVGDGQDALGLGDRGDAGEVDQFQQRVGRRLHPDHFGFRADRGL
jgi:hypothetical protein